MLLLFLESGVWLRFFVGYVWDSCGFPCESQKKPIKNPVGFLLMSVGGLEVLGCQPGELFEMLDRHPRLGSQVLDPAQRRTSI